MKKEKNRGNEITLWYLKVAFIILAVSVVIIAPSFDVKPTAMEQKLFEMIETLPEGSRVVFAVNYGPPARYELEGSMHLLFRELLSRNIGVVFFTLSEIGLETTSMGIREGLSGFSFREGGAVYGRDFANLGFFAGGSIGAGIISRSIISGRKGDVFNNTLDDLPIMNGIVSLSDFEMLIEFASMKIDGTPGSVILNVLSKEKSFPVIAVVSSDMVPEYLPFLDSGRIDVLIKGSRNMASLETIFDRKGVSSVRYSVGAALMLFIIVSIIISNIRFLRIKKK